MSHNKPEAALKFELTTDEGAERVRLCFGRPGHGVSMRAASCITDWTNIRADLIPRDSLVPYLTAFGRASIPVDNTVVASTPSPQGNHISSEISDVLISVDYEAKVASNFASALNLISAALENTDDREVVGQLCDKIDDRLQTIRSKLDLLNSSAQAA